MGIVCVFIFHRPQSGPTLRKAIAQGVVQGLQTWNSDLQGLSDRAFLGPWMMSTWGATSNTPTLAQLDIQNINDEAPFRRRTT